MQTNNIKRTRKTKPRLTSAVPPFFVCYLPDLPDPDSTSLTSPTLRWIFKAFNSNQETSYSSSSSFYPNPKAKKPCLPLSLSRLYLTVTDFSWIFHLYSHSLSVFFSFCLISHFQLSHCEEIRIRMCLWLFV